MFLVYLFLYVAKAFFLYMSTAAAFKILKDKVIHESLADKSDKLIMIFSFIILIGLYYVHFNIIDIFVIIGCIICMSFDPEFVSVIKGVNNVVNTNIIKDNIKNMKYKSDLIEVNNHINMLKTHIKELDEKAELLKENNINIKKTINDLTQDVSLGETRISVINLLNKNISKNDNLLSVMANERKEIGIKIKMLESSRDVEEAIKVLDDIRKNDY